MINVILGIVTLGVFAVVAFDFLKSYYASTSTGWARFIDAARGSATILWSQFGMAVAALVASLDQVLTWVGTITGDSSVTDSIKAAIGNYFTPTSAGIAMVVFAVITVFARSRTLTTPGS